jgi:membrane protein
MQIRGYDVVAVLRKTGKEIGEDKIAVYSGQMAYAMFFSLFPLLIFFAALLSLVGDRSTLQEWLTGRVVTALPRDVAGLLRTTIEKVVFADSAPGLLSFGLLTAAWAGSGMFGAMRDALNAAYDVTETRPRWKQYALQLGMPGLVGIVLLIATVILLNGESVMAWLGRTLQLGNVTTLIWTIVQFPLAIAALVGVVWLVYYLLPNCRWQSKGILLFGACLASLLWIAATLVFRLYVQHFNRLNPAYGAVGAIMLLLTWMYYSSFVFLAVGELNAVLETEQSHRRKERQRAEGERMSAPG